MKLNEISYQNARPIDGYGPGFFRVGGNVVQGAVAILPDRVQSWEGDAAPFVADAANIDVLFLGTGADIANPPEALVAALQDAGIGVEVMSSPSACRTYNVLLSEGRRIAAALMPVTIK